jgi:hypothetical protein
MNDVSESINAEALLLFLFPPFHEGENEVIG